MRKVIAVKNGDEGDFLFEVKGKDMLRLWDFLSGLEGETVDAIEITERGWKKAEKKGKELA
jgi:hypothetical protein